MAASKKDGVPDVVSIPNRITLEVAISQDYSNFVTTWEGVVYTASSPEGLDQALDKGGVPRPRYFKPVTAKA